MSRYYFTVDGRTVLGPLEEEQLLQAVRIGTLPNTTQICQEGFTGWRSVTTLLSTPRVEVLRYNTKKVTDREGDVLRKGIPPLLITLGIWTVLLSALYIWWTQRGPYQWIASIFSSESSYSRTFTELPLVLAFVVALSILVVHLLLQKDDRWYRASTRLAIGMPCALVAAHLGTAIYGVAATHEVRRVDSVAAAAQQAGFLPIAVEVAPSQLLQLQVDRGFAVTETRNGSKSGSANLFIPFGPKIWPDAQTPVLLVAKDYELKDVGKSKDVQAIMYKAPVPYIIRHLRKSDDLHFGVFVQLGTSVRSYWFFSHLFWYVAAFVCWIFWSIRRAIR